MRQPKIAYCKGLCIYIDNSSKAKRNNYDSCKEEANVLFQIKQYSFLWCVLFLLFIMVKSLLIASLVITILIM